MRSNRCGSCHENYTPFPTLNPHSPVPIKFVLTNSLHYIDRRLINGICIFASCRPNNLNLETRHVVEFPESENESKLSKILQSQSQILSSPQSSLRLSSSQRSSFPIKSPNIEKNRSRHSLSTSPTTPNLNSSLNLSLNLNKTLKKITETEKVLIVAQLIRSFVREEVR